VAPLDHPEWFNPRLAFWYRMMTPALVRRSHQIITVSQYTKRRLMEITGAPGARIVVIPNGVDGRFVPQTADDIRRVRQDLGIPSARYVLSLATLEPRKNILGQLQAWSRCVQLLPADVWLVIAGNNGARRVFSEVKLDSPPPRVHFAGFVPDDKLPALYGGAIALLYPSIYEGFGLPVLEAMATGTAVIVSESTALPEVVGTAGIQVDPRNSEAIADAIRRVVEDGTLRHELSRRALRQSRLFSWEKTSELTWEVLRGASSCSVREGPDDAVSSYS
jgi:glycosyltransferase involved in cell wall biosynthesis